MVVFPNAKINLGLSITSKRNDGYHNIDTVFFPVHLQDALEIITNPDSAATGVVFSSSGLPIPGEASSNLCVKAYTLLKIKFPNLPAIQMHLHKHIPMGAGLGGGSADGAFTLLLLNAKYKLNLTEAELIELALQLGSDCPFFIKNTPVHATGRGEIMEPASVDLSHKKIVLVLPGIHVSTALAFKDCPINEHSRPNHHITSTPIATWKDQLVNDFEQTVFVAHPELKKIKETLYDKGALYAAMTGTGSTVFGIFETSPDTKGWFGDNYQVIVC